LIAHALYPPVLIQEEKGLAEREKATLAEIEKRMYDCQQEKQELLASRYRYHEGFSVGAATK